MLTHKTKHALLFLLSAFVVILACPVVRSADVPAKDRTVILVSIDGFPAWMWRDPALPIPNLRRLAREGATADAMTVSNPSITWINHTTMITGVEPRKHGVLYNGLLVRPGTDLPPKVEPWRDRHEMVRVPTLYDAVFAAKMTSAEVDWVAVTNPRTIHWSFPELPKADGEIEKELIAAGELTAEQIDWFKSKNPAWRDVIWTKAACHILKTKRPNLLLFHLLNTDATNHAYGPGTSASFTAYALADRFIGDLLQTIREAGMQEKTTLVITTDHGFKRVKKVIYPNVALRESGLVRTAGTRTLSCDAYVMTQGGLALAYVTDPDKRAELIPKLRETLGKLEGVSLMVDGNEAGQFGMPTPRENQGMGDLILYAKDGYAFQSAVDKLQSVEASTNYLGTHGYQNSEADLDGIFLAWGYGIHSGASLPRVSNLDIAPTLARLLNVEMPPMDGRVLKEFLNP